MKIKKGDFIRIAHKGHFLSGVVDEIGFINRESTEENIFMFSFEKRKDDKVIHDPIVYHDNNLICYIEKSIFEKIHNRETTASDTKQEVL